MLLVMLPLPLALLRANKLLLMYSVSEGRVTYPLATDLRTAEDIDLLTPPTVASDPTSNHLENTGLPTFIQ